MVPNAWPVFGYGFNDKCITTYIPLTLYPEGVAEVPQIFLRDTHVLPKLVSYETAEISQ
jgi:hypothetical protein